MTRIGGGAFAFCTSLIGFSIPASVTAIESDWSGMSPFWGCSSLTTITVDSLNSFYNSVNGVLFNKSQSALIQYPLGKNGSYVIPNSVKNIGSYAFSGSWRLNGVTIPDGVTNIENDAFSFCTGLVNVTVPDSVSAIGSAAFVNCSSLTTVDIGSGVLSIADVAFNNCKNLRGVYFRGNSPSLGTNALSGDDIATIYYLPGMAGWVATLGGRPTALWRPLIQTRDDSFGVRTNQFGFDISWASGMAVAVDVCTNLANPVWTSIQTNILARDTLYFGDPQWTNYPARFYRLRWP